MRVRQHLLVLIACAGAALLALHWPLFHAATHTGSDFPTDYFQVNWNFWWLRHALTTPGLNIYETDFVLFPATTNLAYHTLSPFWFPLWALLEPVTGTLIATNIMMVIAIALNGYFAWLLLRREGVTSGLALVGGLIFALTPAVIVAFMVSHINYVSIFWYPLQLWLWGSVARRDDRLGWGLAVMQGVAFYAMLMTDYQHGVFLVPLLLPYGLLTLAQSPNWTSRARLAGRGLVALAVMIVLLGFVGPLPHILTFNTDNLSPMPIENADGIPFPNGYVSRFETFERRVSLGPFVLPGILLAVIVALMRRRDPRAWFWLALVPLPLALSLGPFITVGDTTVTTPYVIMHELFGGLFRVPARFAPVIVLPALVFAGRVLSPALRGRVGIVSGLILLVMADVLLYGQMPIQPVRPIYNFYAEIAAERGGFHDEYGILDVPVAGGSGEAWVGDFRAMETQFAGIFHEKRMLNGSIARVPLDHFWHWLYDDPLLAWLGQRRLLEPDRVEPLLRDRIHEWPLGYIIVHRDLVGPEAVANQEIIGYFNSLPDLVCPIRVEGPAVVFRTTAHPAGCPSRTPPEVEPGVYLIDIGAPGDEHFMGWGWHRQESLPGIDVRWAGQYPQADIYLDLPPADYTLEFAAQVFHRERVVEVLVNDASVGAVTVPVGALTVLRVDVPAARLGDGQHVRLTLAYDSVDRPAEVGAGDDRRKLAIMVDWLRLTRVSPAE